MTSPRISRIVLLAVLLSALLSGCARTYIYHEAKYGIHGRDPDPRRVAHYIGAVSDAPAARGTEITVRTLQNTVYCRGTLSPAESGESPLTGTGALTCRDGRKLAVRWEALSATTGIAEGDFTDGRTIVFTYGFGSRAESDAAIKNYYKNDDEAAGGPEGSESKPGGVNTQKPGEKPGAEPGKKEKSDWDGNGTGFFISDDGLLVTNYHVVQGAVRVGVEDTIARKEYDAEVIVVDKNNDLAIVKIAAKTKALPLGDSDSVRKGQEVVAMGYPIMRMLGKEQKATFGRINSLSGIQGDVRLFQTDAAIQGGNSGGPLVNMRGEVIGVNSYKLNLRVTLERTNQIVTNDNYAVKVSYLKLLLASLPKQFSVANRSGVRAANMAELVERCERSVVIVWVKKKDKDRARVWR